MRILVIESKPEFGPNVAKRFDGVESKDLTENADEKAVMSL